MILQKAAIEALPQRTRAALINSLPGYKPVVLVGTINRAGQTNLSVINSCFHVGAAPPLLGMIIRPAPDGTERHTLENIVETGCFTLNAITPDMAQRAHHTSARFPRDQSEFDACGFESRYLEGCAAPCVADSPLQIGLTLAEHQILQINGTHLIIGAVELIKVEEAAMRSDGSLNLSALNIVTATGLDTYHSVGVGQRFAYAKPQKIPETL